MASMTQEQGLQIKKGDRVMIYTAGDQYTGEVISADNMTSHRPDQPDNWYLEVYTRNGYGYWKQGVDGGVVKLLDEDNDPMRSWQWAWDVMVEAYRDTGVNFAVEPYKDDEQTRKIVLIHALADISVTLVFGWNTYNQCWGLHERAHATRA